MKIKHLVIGCGLSGIVLAERIANELNEEVMIIEKRNHIGGNCFDFYDDNGILIHKYGPHIFHTNDKGVWNYLNEFSKFNMFQHKVLSYVDGDMVPMPVTTRTISKLVNKELSNKEAKEFIDQSKLNIDKPKNSEEVILSNAGTYIYEKLFKNYTYKQWGVFANELDPLVISRIPIRYNTDDRYFSDKYQGLPIEGYTKMFEKMLDNKNIKIMLNTDYKDVIDDISYDNLYYTGPIDYFYDNKFGELKYRSVKFEFEQHQVYSYQQAPVINYPNDYDFTRITEFKKMTLQRNDNYTTIAKEFPCDSKENGDPYYPFLNDENKEKYTKYRDINVDSNVHFLGRLAEYKYYNMDAIIRSALDLFDKIKS